MSLEQPGWLALLILLPLLGVLAIITTRQRSRAWQALVAPRLRKKLLNASPPHRRWVPLIIALLALALLSLVMTRPNAGTYDVETQAQGRNLIIAIDLSRSMLTEDLSPNRLQIAKATALELLDRFPGDRIGLIAFADEAWLSAPLTLDHQALREVLGELSPHYLPTQGSDLSKPIHLATNTLTATGQSDNALILISDGEDHNANPATKAARTAVDSGLTIFTLGVGTTDGDFIPDPSAPNRKFRDPTTGGPILSALNESSLRSIAASGRGLYSRATGKSLNANLNKAITQLSQSQQKGSTRTIALPRYQWVLLPALLLLAAAHLTKNLHLTPKNQSSTHTQKTKLPTLKKI